MVKSAKAAEWVMDSLTRFVEGLHKLVVNRPKGKSAPLQQCALLGHPDRQTGTGGLDG